MMILTCSDTMLAQFECVKKRRELAQLRLLDKIDVDAFHAEILELKTSLLGRQSATMSTMSSSVLDINDGMIEDMEDRNASSKQEKLSMATRKFMEASLGGR